MEIKDIDLTKCVNCCYKAVIDGVDDRGRICANGKDVYLRSDVRGLPVVSWDDIERGFTGKEVTGFEIVPRDPETYRDWQVGDIIGCLDEEGDMDIIADHLCRVIFRSGELVAIADNYSAEEADINGCYTCSQLFREGWRLVLTDIEQQIIEEKKKYEPQDGDIVTWKDEEDDGDSAVSIYKAKHRSYMTLFITGSCYAPKETLAMGIVRPATEDEKQLLFDAMSKEGKRWNAEKKVVEDIPKPYEFKKGEPVLARNHDYELWSLFAYHKQTGDKHIVKTCFRTVLQSQCIPYNERTMHLLGTSEDYREE